MAYNKRGYFLRAKVLQEIAKQHYEPGRQDRCLKWVWRRHIYPAYGICYRTFLRCLKARDPEAAEEATQLKLFE